MEKKITMKLSKPYERQPEEVKQMLCEKDFDAIRSALNWKNRHKNKLRKLVKGA